MKMKICFTFTIYTIICLFNSNLINYYKREKNKLKIKLLINYHYYY